MATKSPTVTITGNIGTEPTYNTTKTGDPVVNFRVGSSNGYWNRSTGAWVDEGTSWYAVSAFRNLAEHARASLRRGDPVIVTGVLKLKEWENDARKGISADIVADAIGHDLSLGTSAFARRQRAGTAPERTQADVEAREEFRSEPPTYDDEVPADHTAAWEAQGLVAPDDAAEGDLGGGVEAMAEEQEPALAQA